MREHARINPLQHMVKRLFSPRKRTTTNFITRKNDYYRNYYFPKNLCDGIDMVAAVELASKKAAAEMLMKRGLSSYIGGKISEFIESEKIAREHNEKVHTTRFVMLLKRNARERGIDISKLI